MDRASLLHELSNKTPEEPDMIEHTSIFLVSPFCIKKQGQQVRMMISAGEDDPLEAIPALGRVIARSRDWADMIVRAKLAR
jgi:hypothetical protein